MLKDSSANAHEQSPHVNEHLIQTTNPTPIDPALKQRAQAVVDDESIDAESRTIIRYALEINDPWLPELVQRVEAGENIAESFESAQAAAVVADIAREETRNEEKVEELVEIICRVNDRSAAALLVLTRILEKSTQAKLLANRAKHLAFSHCAESNLFGMVDTQTAVIEAELLASGMRMS